MTTTNQSINLLTKQAEQWNEEGEKYIFCLSVLGISPHHQFASKFVERLENVYFSLLSLKEIEDVAPRGHQG